MGEGMQKVIGMIGGGAIIWDSEEFAVTWECSNSKLDLATWDVERQLKSSSVKQQMWLALVDSGLDPRPFPIVWEVRLNSLILGRCAVAAHSEWEARLIASAFSFSGTPWEWRDHEHSTARVKIVGGSQLSVGLLSDYREEYINNALRSLEDHIESALLHLNVP